MSYLTENPEVMAEVIAVLVRRAGGSATITKEDAPGPFTLLSKWDEDGKFHLVLDETVTHEEVQRIIDAEQVGTA